MAKKIVIFGPDNSGKTTLANDICSSFGYEYSHSPGPVSIEEMMEYIEESLGNEKDLVFDRFPPIEERTCGVVLRNNNKFQGMGNIVMDYFSRVDLFIYCNPGMKTIENWQEREQMEGIKENIIALKESYDKLANDLSELGLPFICYDWTKGKMENDNLKRRVKEL